MPVIPSRKGGGPPSIGYSAMAGLPVTTVGDEAPIAAASIIEGAYAGTGAVRRPKTLAELEGILAETGSRPS